MRWRPSEPIVISIDRSGQLRSVAVLAVEPMPKSLVSRLTQEEELHVPHLVDFEFFNVLRGLFLARKITEDRTTAPLDDLGLLPLIRYGHAPLRNRIWELRTNLSAYDATYSPRRGTRRAPHLRRRNRGSFHRTSGEGRAVHPRKSGRS